jgi:hypothetical protein
MISFNVVHGSTLIGEQNNEKTFIYEGRLFVCLSAKIYLSPATTSLAMLFGTVVGKPSSSMVAPS